MESYLTSDSDRDTGRKRHSSRQRMTSDATTYQRASSDALTDDLPPVSPFPTGHRRIPFQLIQPTPPDSKTPTLVSARPQLIPSLSSAAQSLKCDSSPNSLASADSVEYLIFAVTGLGEESEALRQLGPALEVVRGHWGWPVACGVHFEWVNLEQGGNLITDLMSIMVPWRMQKLRKEFSESVNSRWENLLKKFPAKFSDTKISIFAHSLSSCVVFDLEFKFPIHATFFTGSPLGAYLAMTQGGRREPPLRLFNILDESDPIGFRLESLFFPGEAAVVLPAWDCVARAEKSDGKVHPSRRIDFLVRGYSSLDVAFFVLKILTCFDPSAPH